MKKIFITGCARSGTTLLNDLFKSFARTWVIEDEVSLIDFYRLPPEKVGDYDFVVGKRKWETIFSSSRLTALDIERQMFQLKDILIVNIIRDGRNVVKSYLDSWGVYNPFEWMECINQVNRYGSIINVDVRYEELLTDPNTVQEKIMDSFGMRRLFKFSDYPNFIEFDGHNIKQGGYRYRPLDAAKVVPDMETYLQRPNDVKHFNKLLKGLGYECAE